MDGKGRILIVEDDQALITMIQYMLEDEGYDTRNAIGERALALAEDFQPDLILLDIMMPLMDGQEWSIRARANPKLKDIPILVLSAASPEVLLYQYKDLQANSFIPKPFDLDRFMNLIDTYTSNPQILLQQQPSFA